VGSLVQPIAKNKKGIFLAHKSYGGPLPQGIKTSQESTNKEMPHVMINQVP
jgi:hypothetical protein